MTSTSELGDLDNAREMVLHICDREMRLEILTGRQSSMTSYGAELSDDGNQGA